MAFRKNALSYANWSKLVLVSTDSTSWYAKECYTLKSYELQLRKKQCHYKCSFWLGFFNLFSRKPNRRLYIFFSKASIHSSSIFFLFCWLNEINSNVFVPLAFVTDYSSRAYNGVKRLMFYVGSSQWGDFLAWKGRFKHENADMLWCTVCVCFARILLLLLSILTLNLTCKKVALLDIYVLSSNNSITMVFIAFWSTFLAEQSSYNAQLVRKWWHTKRTEQRIFKTERVWIVFWRNALWNPSRESVCVCVNA